MGNTDIIKNYIYMKMKLNDLKNYIENRYISKEQAWDYLNEYIERDLEEEFYNKEKMKENIFKFHPEANKDVIDFIINFNWHSGDSIMSQEMIRKHFRAGYCYYFAIILKEAFERGTVCWCAPFGHLCWVDDDGIPYDIEGVCESDCDYYIPVEYIKEGLVDFKHVPGKKFGATKEYIDDAIKRYKEDQDNKNISCENLTSEMREPTKEERESIDKYIENISKPAE